MISTALPAGRTTSPRGAARLTVALIACTVLSSSVPADTEAAATGRPTAAGFVCSTVKGGLKSSLGTQSYRDRDRDETVTASVEGFEPAKLGRGLVLRTLRRRGRIVGLALCAGKRGVARLPLPADRRSRVVGVSVNADRVAWRTTGTRRRGTLSVGTATSGLVRSVRSFTSRALLGSGSGARVSGRLLVTPDGGATWSLPVGSRVGVWLWPAGERPRRIAVSAKSDPGGERGRDVRIVDRHHVLIGSDGELARYGPRTPGTCPVGIGVHSTTVGPFDLRFSAGSFLEQYGNTDGWSHLLVCDPVVGDYTRVLGFAFDVSGVGGSGNTAESSAPTRAFYTAGTLVVETVRSESFGGSSNTVHGASIIPRDAGGPIASASGGGVAGPGIDAPGAQPGAGATPEPPVGVRVVPGALAWLESAPNGTFTVHVLDAAGTRAVGVATFQTSPGPDGAARPTGPGLTLSATEVAWRTPTGTAVAPVSPTPDQTLASANPTGR